jgi:hypothetical protein
VRQAKTAAKLRADAEKAQRATLAAPKDPVQAPLDTLPDQMTETLDSGSAGKRLPGWGTAGPGVAVHAQF